MKQYPLIIIFITLFVSNLTAQNNQNPTGYFGLGFGIGIIDKKVGINVTTDFKMKSKLGFSIDFQLNGNSPSADEYMSNVSWQAAQNTYQDQKTGEMLENIGINIGINYTIFKNFSLIGGVAYINRNTYWKYFDNLYILGNSGNYVVDYSTEEFYGINYGAIYEINNFYIKATNSTLNVMSFSVGYKIINGY
jgi:hypothetical protein